jgi:hypothetical protein
MLLQMKMARYLPKQMFLIILLEPKLHNSNWDTRKRIKAEIINQSINKYRIWNLWSDSDMDP